MPLNAVIPKIGVDNVSFLEALGLSALYAQKLWIKLLIKTEEPLQTWLNKGSQLDWLKNNQSDLFYKKQLVIDYVVLLILYNLEDFN